MIIIIDSVWKAIGALWIVEDAFRDVLREHDQERARAEQKRAETERKRIESSPEYIAREHARNLARGRRTIDDLIREARSSRR